MSNSEKPSVLYIFPSAMRSTVADIEAGRSPRELIYGFLELRERGYRVSFDDSRFKGPLARLRAKLRSRGVFLIDFKTVLDIARHDVIMVKDNFSVMTTVVAKLLGKRLIYNDSMFDLPRRWIRRAIMRLNMLGADKIIAYSSSQIDLWVDRFGISRDKFILIPVGLEIPFYRPAVPKGGGPPFVLSIGRDVGRDFGTLVDAVEGTGLRLKVVTLPYLIPANARNKPFVEILQRVPYDELFQLYADALLVVVPLKSALTYPSGVRAVWESAAFSKPTIVTRTPVLEEYFDEGSEVFYVEPKSVDGLRNAILTLQHDRSRQRNLGENARRRVEKNVNIDEYMRGVIRAIEGD